MSTPTRDHTSVSKMVLNPVIGKVMRNPVNVRHKTGSNHLSKDSSIKCVTSTALSCVLPITIPNPKNRPVAQYINHSFLNNLEKWSTLITSNNDPRKNNKFRHIPMNITVSIRVIVFRQTK